MNLRQVLPVAAATSFTLALLVACGPSPGLKPTRDSSATEPSFPTPTLEPVQAFPPAAPRADLPLLPGRYRTPEAFAIPFVFELDERLVWDPDYLQLAGMLTLVGGANQAGKPSQWLTFMSLVDGESVTSALAALQTTPDMEPLEAVDVSIAGVAGRRLDAPPPAPGWPCSAWSSARWPWPRARRPAGRAWPWA